MFRSKRTTIPPPSSIRSAALRLLTRRDYTSLELRDKLIDRGYLADDVDALLSDLTTRGLLDDRRAAEAHARTASRIKGRGRVRIARELEARGIARSVITDLVAELPASDEAAAIARFIERKRLPKRLDPAARRRLFQQLLRRGFPVDAISKALREHRHMDEDE